MKKCPNCDEALDDEMLAEGVCDHCGEPFKEWELASGDVSEDGDAEPDEKHSLMDEDVASEKEKAEDAEEEEEDGDEDDEEDDESPRPKKRKH